MSLSKHYFEKTNLISYVLTSMWMLNMRPLVKKLITKYNLSNAPWYDRLLNGGIRNGLSDYNRYESEIRALQALTEQSNQAIESARFCRDV